MDSEIKEFYKCANILITGGTGLLGQLLVEKLLRECSDIDVIYLILRGKRGKSASERISAAFKDPIFDKLREVNPEFDNKIHVLEGDCSQLQLGLDKSSTQVLIEKVNIVFHCAASLNMDAKLQEAVNINIRGLQELLDICRKMENLKSMVFVSTAYSNCIHKVIEEKFYTAPLQPDTILKLTQEMDSVVLDNITPKLINKWPNTYCYSKSIAEAIIKKNADTLPIGLFRPSVIMPTYSEPLPGWTSNLYGPMGFLVATRLGVLRVSYCNPNGKIDFVPADFCTNALICTAWETNKKFDSPNSEVAIYNYCAGQKLNIPIKLMAKYVDSCEYPLSSAMWVTRYKITNCKPYYTILQLLLHHIPGYIIDGFLLVSGKKTRMIKTYEKLAKMTDVLGFFTCQEWRIVNDNVYKLWNRLNETDKKLFPFNMDSVDYQYYLIQCSKGIKTYILKESYDNLEEDKKRYKRLNTVHNTLKFILLFITFIVIYTVIRAVFF